MNCNKGTVVVVVVVVVLISMLGRVKNSHYSCDKPPNLIGCVKAAATTAENLDGDEKMTMKPTTMIVMMKLR